MILFWLLIGILVSSFFVECVLLILARRKHLDFTDELISFPMVSILVAARNEEQVIKRCLDSLLKLQYPKNKIEILIGDDNSEDKTLSILKSYEATGIQVHHIRSNIASLKGKANVLAQLAQKSIGEYLFFTDADIVVSTDWIKGLLVCFQQNTGLVCGLTSIEDQSIFETMQRYDWLYSFSLLKLSTDYGHPLTGVGNNMAVRKEAYLEVGGFEGIGFSVTEDFHLFDAIKKKGYQTNINLGNESRNVSLPIPDLAQLFVQRKRWMVGVMQLPLLFLAVLMLQASFLPIIFALSFYNPLFLLFLLFKIFLKKQFLKMNLKAVNEPINYYHLPLFEIYSSMVSLGSLTYSLLPFKIVWKGRSY